MDKPPTNPTPTPTEGPVLVETRQSEYLYPLQLSDVFNEIVHHLYKRVCPSLAVL